MMYNTNVDIMTLLKNLNMIDNKSETRGEMRELVIKSLEYTRAEMDVIKSLSKLR